jgi:signal transduction histidine kinase
MRSFRTLRGRLTAVALLAALVGITALTVVFNVVLTRSLDADADSRLRSLAAAAGTTVVHRQGHLRLRESPDDAALDQQVWIYEGTRAIERPPAIPELQRAADALAGQTNVFDDVLGGEVRLHAAPLTDDGIRTGTVVTGTSLVAYRRTLAVALIGSLAFAALLLAAVFWLTWVTIGRALDPVRQMTRLAVAWSENEPGRRFGATPRRPDELGELAQAFDALLDRVAGSLRHEQRLSAELSHELRTPLSRVIAEIELLQRRERSREDRDEGHALIARSADQMSGILETLMAAARTDARLDAGRSEVGDTLTRLADEFVPPPGARDVMVDLRTPPAPLMAGVDADIVERIVAPLLDNAGRFARSRVTLGAAADHGRVIVTVADDGPGVPDDARVAIFEPGTATPTAGHSGAGLGLPLARRLAKAAGGDVTLSPGAPGAGAEFRVVLPA